MHAADPILLLAGRWLGMASGVLALLMVAGFAGRWGIRFRLVGITSFTTLLAISCVAFAISYSPRQTIPGAVSVPVVFDNGNDLVVAAAPLDLPPQAYAPTVEQLARNLRGSGRSTADGRVVVRLRRVEPAGEGLSRPVVLAEAQRDLIKGSVDVIFGADGTGPASGRSGN
ncbi:MAG: DUF2518 family protein [Cyanobacteriota bacterium]|nr:DUF2518 family protein [Cyanobacteriota bacterium]